jgi:hypothetical protein
MAAFRISGNPTQRVTPESMKWRGKVYPLSIMGLYHPEQRGTKRIHIFSFSSGQKAFRVELDPDTITWTLVEVYHAEKSP